MCLDLSERRFHPSLSFSITLCPVSHKNPLVLLSVWMQRPPFQGHCLYPSHHILPSQLLLCLLTPALVTLEPSLSKAARLVLLNESQIISPTLTGLVVAWVSPLTHFTPLSEERGGLSNLLLPHHFLPHLRLLPHCVLQDLPGCSVNILSMLGLGNFTFSLRPKTAFLQ